MPQQPPIVNTVKIQVGNRACRTKQCLADGTQFAAAGTRDTLWLRFVRVSRSNLDWEAQAMVLLEDAGECGSAGTFWNLVELYPVQIKAQITAPVLPKNRHRQEHLPHCGEDWATWSNLEVLRFSLQRKASEASPCARARAHAYPCSCIWAKKDA